MFRIYITFNFIFFYIQAAFSLHSNSKEGANGHEYFILDPIKYNTFVLNLINNPEEISLGNSFRNSDNQGQITLSKLKDVLCKESDLVFSNVETNTNHTTVLNLNTGNSRVDRSKNYLLLFGADRCILDSSLANRKPIKINIRVIPDLRNPTREVYQDKTCDCLFKRGNVHEGGHSEFQINCNSDLLYDSNKKVQERDYLEIGGVEALNVADLVNLPTLITDKNFQADKKIKSGGSEVVSVKLPRSKPSRIKTLKPKANELNFSKYFWETNSGFFGEGQEAIKKANIEYCESHGQSESCQNEEKSKIEEFRESCNNKEHQLILETLLIIVNKLIEHLDGK
ncbi:signal peptide protein [Cryptosporidium sp. chipmunk genotype I]|uniref:signal peptide protein n=1 Tax=Cryptosporidium sp. chipmunk genotype I TaxID=1280935 RepID=UPI00351A8AFB|nr:signal peptide protein [Cryptosporidium sp. chipmunk genotype I]